MRNSFLYEWTVDSFDKFLPLVVVETPNVAAKQAMPDWLYVERVRFFRTTRRDRTNNAIPQAALHEGCCISLRFED